MKLTIVGCAGSFPGPDSPASCYLLETEAEGRTWRIVLDLGNGTLGHLQRYTDPRDIDALAITHLHPDHCIDLTSYTVLSKYHPQGRYPTVPIFAPAGAASYIAAASGPGGEPPRELLDFRDWAHDPVLQMGPFTVRSWLVDHPITAYGLRIEVGDKVIAYSGDTGPTPALAELARDADLFLCEASFVESGANPPNLHLTGADAGRAARAAGAKRLLVTHIPAWTDAAEVERDLRSTWDGPYRLVAAGDTFEV